MINLIEISSCCLSCTNKLQRIHEWNFSNDWLNHEIRTLRRVPIIRTIVDYHDDYYSL